MSSLMRVKVLDPEHAYLLTLDRPNSSANILDLETLQELDERLRALSGDTGCRGLIIESAKPAIFIAGADINQIGLAKSGDELANLVRLGQQVMNRLATFHAPTVSCIHGACLGGGFEFSLACDYRLASRDRATQIGLPEINLGLLPCWGGCTRLPRLAGLPVALDLILHGKRLAAATALKHGLVDELVPREHQLAFALNYIARGKPARKSHSRFATGTAATKARKTMLAKTRGNYPAVDKALEVMVKGLATTTEQSLLLESQALLELARTPACRNLVRIYQMTEKARKLGARTKTEPVRQTAVIGAGAMGSALAQWISSRGTRVVLHDRNPEAVARGLATAARLYQEGAKKSAGEENAMRQGLDRIAPATGDIPLHIMDFIMEAVEEKIDLKKDVFRYLEERAGPLTILASNTSALPISELAACVKNPGQVIGLHFFNPVHRMRLVEVVAAPQTAAATIERAVKFVQQLGKLPVVVRDSPGFIVNRILTPYLLHAVTLFQAGHDARAIDDTMLDFGMPAGPLRYLDETGLDTFLQVAEGLGTALGKRFSIPSQVMHMVKQGSLGKKAGKGFYQYPQEGQPQPNPETRPGTTTKAPYVHPRELQRQLALLMVNEAARCLDEKVVEQPADLDFAMIMGAGFAPFRGGPLRHADEDGITEVLTDLMRFAREDSRFEPCSLLTRLATKGGTFYPPNRS